MHIRENGTQNTTGEPGIYTFLREDGFWYLHLSDYLKQGWSKADLQIRDGADRFLNFIARGATKLQLFLSRTPIQEAHLLSLVEHSTEPAGGAIYTFRPHGDGPASTRFLICDMALLIFGDIPDSIYVKRLGVKQNSTFQNENRR